MRRSRFGRVVPTPIAFATAATLATVATVATVAGWLQAPEANAGQGAVCESKPTGSVMLLILGSEKKVHDYAATLQHIPTLRSDRSTVVFEDGRIVTADPGAAGNHLNELGWSSLPLQVVASFGIKPQRRRSFG